MTSAGMDGRGPAEGRGPGVAPEDETVGLLAGAIDRPQSSKTFELNIVLEDEEAEVEQVRYRSNVHTSDHSTAVLGSASCTTASLPCVHKARCVMAGNSGRDLGAGQDGRPAGAGADSKLQPVHHLP
jgi:hypothetical protein